MTMPSKRKAKRKPKLRKRMAKPGGRPTPYERYAGELFAGEYIYTGNPG